MYLNCLTLSLSLSLSLFLTACVHTINSYLENIFLVVFEYLYIKLLIYTLKMY